MPDTPLTTTGMDNADVYKGLAGEAAVKVSVLFFARLREAFGIEREDIVVPGPAPTVSALQALLRQRGGAWEKELAPNRPVRIAVNQDMASADTPLRAGDEVAVFPPVTGG